MKHPARSCYAKMQLSRADAFAVVREIRGRGKRTGNTKHHMKAYQCIFCGCYHVGHESPPKAPMYKRVKRVRWEVE